MDVFDFLAEENGATTPEGVKYGLGVLEYNRKPNWRVSGFGGLVDDPAILEAEAIKRFGPLDFEDVEDLVLDKLGGVAWKGKWNCVYVYESREDGRVVRLAHLGPDQNTDKVFPCGGSTSSNPKPSAETDEAE